MIVLRAKQNLIISPHCMILGIIHIYLVSLWLLLSIWPKNICILIIQQPNTNEMFYYEIPKKINYRQMDFISLPLPVMVIKCKYNILLPLFCVFVDVWT